MTASEKIALINATGIPFVIAFLLIPVIVTLWIRQRRRLAQPLSVTAGYIALFAWVVSVLAMFSLLVSGPGLESGSGNVDRDLTLSLVQLATAVAVNIGFLASYLRDSIREV